MLIHKMTAVDVVNTYIPTVPVLFETVNKYPDQDFVVFEEDNVPKLVCLYRSHDVLGKTMHILTGVAHLTYDLELSTMRSFRDRYGKKTDLVAYDLPQQVHIDEVEPAIMMYTCTEHTPASAFQTIELDDSDDTIGTEKLTEMIQQTPGVSFSLGYRNPAKQASVARFLAETHNYQMSRRIYIL